MTTAAEILQQRRNDVLERLFLHDVNKRRNNGNPWATKRETEADMIERVAALYPPALEFLRRWEIVPNTPALANAGTLRPLLNACFVFDIQDNLDDILKVQYKAGMTQKFGGGTGFYFGRLSPQGHPLSSGGQSSGMMSFFRHFNHLTETIKQGGVRRGANMAQVGTDHPEVRDFIASKTDPEALRLMARNPKTKRHELEGVLENFNISVQAKNDFMRAVENESAEESELFDLICRCAWLTADPGIVFYDTAQKGIRFPELGPLIGTNPCGEQWMRDNEACSILTIPLTAIIVDGKICWEKYRALIHMGIDFLNAMIDQGWWPLEEIKLAVRRNRRVGLGVMGLADLLILLGVPYNSQEAKDIWRDVIRFHCEEARAHSDSRGYRNENVTTIAPNGTTSFLAGCCGGLEPYPGFDVINENTHGKYRIHYPIVEQCPDPRALVAAQDVPWRDHLAMQIIAQEYVDNAVSKTINLPETATLAEVREIYLSAWRGGLKGVTVYRDKCRGKQVYSTVEGEGAACPKGGCV